MIRTKHTTTLLAMMAIAAASAQTPAAPAQGQPELSLWIVSTDKDGKEVLKPAEGKAVPGAIIERQVSVKVAKATRNARITLPISPMYDFQANSDEVSINGKAFTKAQIIEKVTYTLVSGKPELKDYSREPMKTIEVDEGGKKVSKTIAAPANEFRGVSYALGDLKAGDIVIVKHRVKVK